MSVQTDHRLVAGDEVLHLSETLRDDWAASRLTRTAYAAGLVLDGQFPHELVRRVGPDAVEHLLHEDAPARAIDQWDVQPTPTGFVVEYGDRTVGEPSYASVGVMVATVADGRISRLVVTCAGAWDGDTETRILAARDGGPTASDTPTGSDADAEAEAGALAERVFDQAIGSLEIGTLWLGTRLGLYEATADGTTFPQLAERTGIAPRYAQEWLEQQAIAGYVHVDDPAAPAEDRTFRLTPAQRLVLADPESPAYVGPLPLLCVGILAAGEQVREAFLSGGGVPFGAYGDDVRVGQAAFNRGDFLTNLTGSWLEAMPEVAALLARPGARAADLGCGAGWSSVALAQAFPDLTVIGVDSDEASILDARRNAAEAGVADRVEFEVASADDALDPDSVDVAFFLECLHDMGHPVEALASVRGALRPGARVVVMDEQAAETFAPDGSPLERIYGAASVLHCLPVGMSEPGSAGTGALFRPATLRTYAAEAGYRDVVLPAIEHDFMRFYVLEP